MGLPLAKLRQVPPLLRAALKVRHITTCDQLLAAAARFEDRAALAHAARIEPDRLTDLVRQADLERVKGVGWAFGLMLEALGIGDVAMLARSSPAGCTSSCVGTTRPISCPVVRPRPRKSRAGSTKRASCLSWSPTRPGSGRRATSPNSLYDLIIKLVLDMVYKLSA